MTNNKKPDIILMLRRVQHFGVWLSLVERLVRDQEVGCSNHLTPTIESLANSAFARLFTFPKIPHDHMFDHKRNLGPP